MNHNSGFLSNLKPLNWSPDIGVSTIHTSGVYIGKGALGFEVLVACALYQPNNREIRRLWKNRKGGRGCPLLLVVLYENKVSLCGASGDEPPIHHDMNSGQVERLCLELLNQPDRHIALRLFSQVLPSFNTDLAGLRNEGLLALHELIHGVPKRSDLQRARSKSRDSLNKYGQELLESLGFTVERLDNLTSVLRSNDRKTALAVMLHEGETVEHETERFNQLSPVSYAFRNADKEDLKWIIFIQKNRIRLYSTDINVGVGRRGRTETYIECQPWLLSDEQLHYLWLLFSAEAIAPNGSIYELLEGSTRFAGDLAKQLRERIYDRVVPTLAKGISQARGIENPDSEDLDLTYEMALTVLFRLLFIAYAEDRDLLPYQNNDAYQRRSLKVKARELVDAVIHDKQIASGSTHWQETVHLFEAVARGNPEWGVPAYGGDLFLDEEEISKAGAALSKISLPNECFESALRSLLISKTPEGLGPVDFRSLGVREFGTIYEGLLESGLAIAEIDLVLKKRKKDEVYAPAKEGDIPIVNAGEVYLHNQSGARKSSGSYYTKDFVVDYLLEGALKPALEDHFNRLDQLDEIDASEAFFDFRVADIAMGSGHFLISAIDMMEQKMADYLAMRHLPEVKNELAQLRSIALETLRDTGQDVPAEDSQLLRRLIARRCIYGVDINPLAVQLARLAVWIHTFVPGLPLSFLDRTLIQGNSLVGIGNIDELRNKFEEVSSPLFNLDPEGLLGNAVKPLQRLANNNDSSLADIDKARTAQDDVRDALQNTKILCDFLTAAPIVDDPAIKEVLDEWEEFSGQELDKEDPKIREVLQVSHKALDPLSVVHFPIVFPEVFLRKNPGFDVILGNPPWDKIKVDKHAFWARHFPGLRGQSQRVQESTIKNLQKERIDLDRLYHSELSEKYQLRKAIIRGDYPGIGSGDPDLYKAFCWRFWRLSSYDSGYIGVVLPRNAAYGKGSTEFREALFKEAELVNVTTLTNRAEWIFDNIHQQMNIVLLSTRHGQPKANSITLRGPFTSLSELRDDLTNIPPTFSYHDIKTWNGSMSLPLLPTPISVDVFLQLRKSPWLDLKIDSQWRARPDSELHATNQKPLMDFESVDCPEGYWPIYKGESFDLWNPDTGIYYAWANPDPVIKYLQDKRVRAKKYSRGAHSEFPANIIEDQSSLSCYKPRIAFRNVTNRMDRRSMIACLAPPYIFITNAAPYFLWPRGNEQDQAFLLGILSSIPLDWYARRFVNLNLNFFVINPFPIPRLPRHNPLWKRVVELSGRLACPDDRFANWANIVGVECGPLDDSQKENMIHELDAVAAHLYGLNESQLTHIFETFRVNWNYEHRLSGVLLHFNNWRSKL